MFPVPYDPISWDFIPESMATINVVIVVVVGVEFVCTYSINVCMGPL